MPALVTETEIKKVTRLVERKTGVTRQQVVDKLKVTPSRAKSILEKISAVQTPLGKGRNCRTLIYSAAPLAATKAKAAARQKTLKKAQAAKKKSSKKRKGK